MDASLGETCALAYAGDIACGAGVAALLSLLPPDGCTASSADISVPGVPGVVRRVSFLLPGGSVRSTLLLVLSTVCEADHTAVAYALYSFAAGTPLLVIAAAMRVPALLDDAGTVRALAFNGASSSKRPGFPAETPVPCGFLAALLHFCRSGGKPTLALMAPAHRARSSADADASECARTLAVAVCGALGCGFGGGKGEPERRLASSESAAQLMYL
jgi:hypothetical protein